MKKIFIILLSTLMTLWVMGQSKKANQIIDNVSKKANSYESFKVDFTFEIANPDTDDKESNKGTLLVKGDKYRLYIAGQLVICDGETIWTYLEDAEEVQINALEEDEDAITPSNIFTFYDENYKARFIKEDIQNGKTIQIVELKPNEDRNYSKVDLFIDKEETQLSKIIIFDKNGGTITYIIDEFQSNLPVDDTEFLFNEADYPNVEVIDMR
ncbi:MAG: outer membrane lipoprotein carrier protein LolA [Bacteroidota bacterium]|nr:outer membrane lipoprotein carrier protein LolA [Bacteroidota bacterium]